MTTQNALKDLKPTADNILSFFESLPEEKQAEIGDLETPEGFGAAREAFLAAQADDGGEPSEKKGREARDFTVMVMILTGENAGRFEVVGTGLGSAGREASDPSKWSVARSLRNKAEVRVAKMRRNGEQATVLVVPTEEHGLGAFLGV